MSSPGESHRHAKGPPPEPPKTRRAIRGSSPSTHPTRATAIASTYLMNDIPRDTPRAKLINSLLAPGHEEDEDNTTSTNLQPDVQFGIVITNSRLDDEQNVATIKFSDTPKWLLRLSRDPCGFPKRTTFGTIWKDVDRSAVDNEGKTEFIRAVINGKGNLGLVYAEMLAEFEDTPVNVQDSMGRTALHWASAEGLSEMVRLCLSIPECDIGLKDNDGFTAFDVSLCRDSRNESIPTLFYTSMIDMHETHPQEALLRSLTVTSVPAEDRRIFPGIAIFEPIKDSNEPLVRALINRGIDLTARNQDGDTALHAAASIVDNVDIMSLLLDAGSDINAIGEDGGTPLHRATGIADIKMVQVLLDWDADITVEDEEDMTALDWAMRNEQRNIARLLTVSEANPDNGGITLEENHDSDTMESLKRVASAEEADQLPLKEDQWIRTVPRSIAGQGTQKRKFLIQAVQDGDLDAVREHMKLGKGTEARYQITHRTPLQLAAELGHTEMVDLLLAGGAKIEASTGKYNWTALQIAADNGNRDIVETLLDKGAQVEGSDASQQTPLHLSVSSGHKVIVEILLTGGAQIDATGGEFNWTALHIAVVNGHRQILKTLLDNGAQIAVSDSSGRTPLHLSAGCGHTELVEILLDNGANIEARGGGFNWTALQFAADRGATESVRILLDKGAQIEGSNTSDWTPLHLSANNGHTDIVQILLAGGANIASMGKLGNTALPGAAAGGHTEIVRTLLAAGSNTEELTSNKETPLICSARFGHTGVVDLLLAGGAQTEAKGNEGLTALLVAASGGHTETVRALLAAHANTEAHVSDNKTALIISAKRGYTEIVVLLLAGGAQIEATENRGRTALLVAASKGQTGIVQELLARGGNIKAVTTEQETALHLAASGGHIATVETLLANGAQIDAIDEGGSTAMDMAYRMGHKETGCVLRDAMPSHREPTTATGRFLQRLRRNGKR